MDNLETLAVVLPGTINTAIKYGVDIQAILHKFGISVDLKNITQSTINLQLLHAIIKEIEEEAKTPAIGLQTGQDFDFDFLPSLKTYLMSASTVRDVFAAGTLFKKLISPILNLVLEESGDEAKLILRPDTDLSTEDGRYYVEMVFSTLKTLVVRLSKEDCSPKAVCFCHNQTHLLNIYERFFNCRIRLGEDENIMIFDKHLLDKPLPGRFPELHRQARQILVQQIADSPLNKGIAQKITRIIKKHKNLASGFAIYEQSTRGASLVGAFAATADDESALWYNPAGITQMPGPRVMQGVINYYVKTRIKFDGGDSSETVSDIIPIPHLFATRQFNDKIWAGIGFYAPYGLGTEFDENWAGRYNGYFASNVCLELNPNIAYKITDALSLGIGVSIQRFEFEMKQKSIQKIFSLEAPR